MTPDLPSLKARIEAAKPSAREIRRRDGTIARNEYSGGYVTLGYAEAQALVAELEQLRAENAELRKLSPGCQCD